MRLGVPMELYPGRALERAMKVQEVILRAIGGQINWMQAAEIIGLSDRSMRRWRVRYEEHGYDGLFDRRLKRPSPRRVALKVVEEVLRLYREQYFDFNVRHFHEKLQEEHQVAISYRWVKGILQGAGMVAQGGSAECIASGVRGGPCRGCCCTSMAAITAGFRMSVGTT